MFLDISLGPSFRKHLLFSFLSGLCVILGPLNHCCQAQWDEPEPPKCLICLLFEDVEVPTTKDVLGVHHTVLPASFPAEVQRHFPDYRLPDEGDKSNFWGWSGLGEFRLKEIGIPFLAIGDLNGDTLTDISVFIRQKERYWNWNLVTFIKDLEGDGYTPHILVDGSELSTRLGMYYIMIIPNCSEMLSCLEFSRFRGKERRFEWDGKTLFDPVEKRRLEKIAAAERRKAEKAAKAAAKAEESEEEDDESEEEDEE